MKEGLILKTLLDRMFLYNPGINEFRIYGELHLLCLLMVAVVLFLMVRHKEKIKTDLARKFEITLGIILVTPRLLMYVWYLQNETSLQELLPLYLCRIVIICTAITLFTGSSKLHFIMYYWGLFGSVLALLFPDTSGYDCPHIMFISFFVGHGALAISVFYIIIIKGFIADKESLMHITICTIAYIAIACIVNKLVGGNYNYLEMNPVSFPLPINFVRSIFYKLSILGVFLLLVYIEYLPFAKKRKEIRVLKI